MRKLFLGGFLLLLSLPYWGIAQQYSWVYLSDKGPEAEYYLSHPEAMLSPRALERRARHRIPVDLSDVPVSRHYRAGLKNAGAAIGFGSRWLNAVVAEGSPAELQHLLALPYVKAIRPVARYEVRLAHTQETQQIDYGDAALQTQVMNLDYLHDMGYRGQGVLMAFFDSGYNNLNALSPFDSMFTNSQLLTSYDFYSDQPIDFSQDNHGTVIFSTVAANQPGVMVGTATGATYALARTENVGYERNIEEVQWQRAAEWADSLGADIINSSLAYNIFDSGQNSYSYAEMDGQTSVIVQAAETAYSKGILVVNSAGNEGGGSWQKIVTPCDGPNVLCVGAVDRNLNITGFSSRGPTGDGRLKPDIVAVGGQATFYSNSGVVAQGNGTSFSSPIAAGFAACLLSAFPNATNAQLRQAIIQSADRFQNPDTVYGHGLPNAILADSLLRLSTGDTPSLAPDRYQLHYGPNPTSDELRVWVEGRNFDRYTLRLVNTAGQVVLELPKRISNVEYRISTRELRAGLYLLQTEHPGDLETVRILVE